MELLCEGPCVDIDYVLGGVRARGGLTWMCMDRRAGSAIALEERGVAEECESFSVRRDMVDRKERHGRQNYWVFVSPLNCLASSSADYHSF